MGERSPLKKCNVLKGSLFSPLFILGVLKRLGVFYCTKLKVETPIDSNCHCENFQSSSDRGIDVNLSATICNQQSV